MPAKGTACVTHGQRPEVGRQLLIGQPGDLMRKAVLRMEVIQKAVSRQMVSKAGTDVTLH